MSKPQFELAQVIRNYGDHFTTKHPPLKQHLSVLNAIQKCRTATLGGHVDNVTLALVYASATTVAAIVTALNVKVLTENDG